MELLTAEPDSLVAAVDLYSDPVAAHAAFTALRWSGGVPYCPRCCSLNIILLSTGLIWNCRHCRRKFTAKVGTPLEDSPVPLTKWLPVYWAVVNDLAPSIRELARLLAISPKTAWLMMQRVRQIVDAGTFEK